MVILLLPLLLFLIGGLVVAALVVRWFVQRFRQLPWDQQKRILPVGLTYAVAAGAVGFVFERIYIDSGPKVNWENDVIVAFGTGVYHVGESYIDYYILRRAPGELGSSYSLRLGDTPTGWHRTWNWVVAVGESGEAVLIDLRKDSHERFPSAAEASPQFHAVWNQALWIEWFLKWAGIGLCSAFPFVLGYCPWQLRQPPVAQSLPEETETG